MKGDVPSQQSGLNTKEVEWVEWKRAFLASCYAWDLTIDLLILLLLLTGWHARRFVGVWGHIHRDWFVTSQAAERPPGIFEGFIEEGIPCRAFCQPHAMEVAKLEHPHVFHTLRWKSSRSEMLQS